MQQALNMFCHVLFKELKTGGKDNHGHIIGQGLRAIALALLAAGYHEFGVDGDTKDPKTGQKVNFKFKMTFKDPKKEEKP